MHTGLVIGLHEHGGTIFHELSLGTIIGPQKVSKFVTARLHKVINICSRFIPNLFDEPINIVIYRPSLSNTSVFQVRDDFWILHCILVLLIGFFSLFG